MREYLRTVVECR